MHVVAPDGGDETITWEELLDDALRAAAALADHGVDGESVVGVALPSGREHLRSTLGAWALGATVVALAPHLAPDVASRLRAQAGAALTIGHHVGDLAPEVLADSPRRAAIPPGAAPRSATASGGSTGAPRLIVRPTAWRYGTPALSPEDERIGLREGQVQLVSVPMYHSGFTAVYHGLALDHEIVLAGAIDANLLWDCIERFRVEVFRVVPTMMRLLNATAAGRDASSVRAVHQGGAACPIPDKRRFLEVFPPEVVYEGYSSQERIGAVWIRGDEWLRHPGSVGRPENCEVRILDQDGHQLPPGATGEIFMRAPFSRQPTYLGPGPQLPERDGFMSLGDLGWLDADGYLYVLDRRADAINVGGATVYPAEIEAALLAPGDLADAAVIGVSNRLLGEVPVALVVPNEPEAPPSVEALAARCRAALPAAAVPLDYRLVDSLPREANGKLRRSALVPTAAPSAP